jgi:hypothetical protein
MTERAKIWKKYQLSKQYAEAACMVSLSTPLSVLIFWLEKPEKPPERP